jgi:hypothetical protein
MEIAEKRSAYGLKFGSYSTATLRTEDLLQAYVGIIEHCIEKGFKPTKSQENDLDKANTIITQLDSGLEIDDIQNQVYYEIESLLDDLAMIIEGNLIPDYAYFGSTPGDGADIGIWLIEDITSQDISYPDNNILEDYIIDMYKPENGSVQDFLAQVGVNQEITDDTHLLDLLVDHINKNFKD